MRPRTPPHPDRISSRRPVGLVLAAGGAGQIDPWTDDGVVGLWCLCGWIDGGAGVDCSGARVAASRPGLGLV